MIKLKFNNWEYFKLIVLLSIFMSIFFMKKYESYGSKGEYILTEHGSESQSYFNNKVTPASKICNPNCAKDCQNKIKEGNFNIIDCLDLCACNINEFNKTMPTSSPESNKISLLTLFIFINILFMAIIVTYYQHQVREYTTYALYRLNLIKKNKNKTIYDENDEEDINEYKKLTDI
jgi:hypothetical protein